MVGCSPKGLQPFSYMATLSVYTNDSSELVGVFSSDTNSWTISSGVQLKKNLHFSRSGSFANLMWTGTVDFNILDSFGAELAGGIYQDWQLSNVYELDWTLTEAVLSQDFVIFQWDKVNSSSIPVYHESGSEEPDIGGGEDSMPSIKKITLSCPTQGATIRYTTDGRDPTESSPAYVSPFEVNQGVIVKAKAFKSGYRPSNVVSNSD